MPVITLDQDGLMMHTKRLGDMLPSPQGYDAIVGIANGGAIVARMVCESLHIPAGKYHEVLAQRPSTSAKSKWLSRLPYVVTDVLRIIESYALRARRHKCVRVDAPRGIDADARRILVIDDAVDSGATLKSVVDSISSYCPMAKIDTAVLTVTTAHPCIQPDYALYRGRTLIRFPWSNDYHGL